MFTQCPNCETLFEVSAEQLKAANGDVRCGQCLNIFSALDHLSEDVPASVFLEDTDQSEQIDFTTKTDAETDIEPESPETVASQQAVIDEPDNQDEQTAVEAVTEPEETHKPSFETKSPEPESLDAESPVTESLETESSTFTEEASAENTADDQELTDFFGDAIDDSVDSQRPIENPAPNNIAAKDGSDADADGFFYGANESTIEKILLEQEPDSSKSDEDTEATKPTSENTDVPATEATTEKESQSTQIPDHILEELEASKAEQLKAPNTSWIVGSVVLMLIFVFQAIYFSRNDLAKDPSLRPVLASACEILGCSINIPYDIKLIEIIGRDVRTHPSASKSLIAGTTLINNATFTQPYPLLTLTFSGITGTRIAQRRFTPREYLRSGTDIKAGMSPDLPVQVELELVDPGKAAVNFEFHADIDPRSIPRT